MFTSSISVFLVFLFIEFTFDNLFHFISIICVSNQKLIFFKVCVCTQHSMWKPEYNFQESVLYFLLCGINGFSSGHQACATNAFMCQTTLDPCESNFSLISFWRVCSKNTITGYCYCRISKFRMSYVAFVFVFLCLLCNCIGVYQRLFCCFLKNQLYSFSWEGLGRSRNSKISSLVQQLRVPVSSWHYSLSGTVSVRAITAGVPHCACAPAN